MLNRGAAAKQRRKSGLDARGVVTDLFILRRPPEYIRSDNGAEFIAKKGGRPYRRDGNQDGLPHAKFTLRKRILREFQRTVPGRIYEW